MKVLQVHLSEEQHKRLRVMSAERCVAMSELVRWWIDGGIERGKVSEGGVVELVGKAVKTAPAANSESKNAIAEGKPKVDQKTCKHSYVACDSGGMVCWKCGHKTI